MENVRPDITIDLSEFNPPPGMVKYSKELLEEGKKYYGTITLRGDGMEIKGNKFKIKITEDEQTWLDEDTYCPMKKMNIELSLLEVAQHDGHGWSKNDVLNANHELLEEIMTGVLGPRIERFIREVQPFKGHYFGEEKLNEPKE